MDGVQLRSRGNVASLYYVRKLGRGSVAACSNYQDISVYIEQVAEYNRRRHFI